MLGKVRENDPEISGKVREFNNPNSHVPSFQHVQHLIIYAYQLTFGCDQNLQSTKSEVCNCKLIRINNQVLLDDGNRIIITQGNFKVQVFGPTFIF